MKHLSKQQIRHLYSLAIIKTGGLDGMRDEGLLESALNSSFSHLQSKSYIHLFSLKLKIRV